MDSMDNRQATGRKAEDIAAEFLRDRGMEVVARNFRCRLGEIDLIGQEGGTVVFVEVKSRSRPGRGLPQEAVSREKQRRLTRLAQWYLKEMRMERQSARFDVIAVTWVSGVPEVTWIANAFEACQ
jgi:putative endonuclease